MNTTSKFLFGLFASAALLAAPACDSGAKKATDDQKVEKAEAKAEKKVDKADAKADASTAVK